MTVAMKLSKKVKDGDIVALRGNKVTKAGRRNKRILGV